MTKHSPGVWVAYPHPSEDGCMPLYQVPGTSELFPAVAFGEGDLTGHVQLRTGFKNDTGKSLVWWLTIDAYEKRR